MVNVLILICIKDERIVHDSPETGEAFERLGHSPIIVFADRADSKRSPEKLVTTKRSNECCEHLTFLIERTLVIALDCVDCGEELCGLRDVGHCNGRGSGLIPFTLDVLV